MQQQYESVRRSVLTGVKSAYFQLAYLSKTLGILESDGQLLEQIQKAADARYRSGMGNQHDLLQAQLERTKLLREITMHHLEVAKSQAQIKQLLNRPQSSPDIEAAYLSETPLPYTFEELLAATKAQNPEISGAQKMVERQNLQVDLARKDFYPDFNVQYMWQRTDPAQFRAYCYMLSVGVRVPIYRGRKQRPELAQAEADLSRSRSESESQSQQVAFDVRTAYDTAQNTSELLKIYREGLLPQARAEFEAGIPANQNNRQDFQPLLASFLRMCSIWTQSIGKSVAEPGNGIGAARTTDRTVIPPGRGQEMKTYRLGFVLALIGNALLAVVLAGLWFHYRAAKPMANTETKPSASFAQDSTVGSIAATPESTEAALVPVQISSQRLQSIGVTIGEVQRKTVEDEIRTTGNVAVDETRLAYVQVRYSGYVQKVFADATYQYVRKGQPLVSIYSPELVATEREYLVAKQNQQQVAQSTVPGVASGAASLLDAAADRLQQWGVQQTEITRLETTSQVQQQIEVDSPTSGYITERNALASVAVQPDMRLYTIADLSTVWVQAQVFQDDLGRIKVDDPATLTVNTFPGRSFSGRVDFIYPQVDADTRTAKVRVVFSNPSLHLKPGMFVNVVLKVPMGNQLVIPANGVLQSGTREIAFVQRSDGYIEPREMQLGARVGDDFIVLRGLKAGEQIVTSANFLIDSESQLQAALGTFIPPPPGAGAASAMNAAQANAELTSVPNPPNKGNNIFRIKLTDSGGSSIAGAEVSATFFMPAMPAMGMAAMRTTVALSDKGKGLYEGTGELGSGGTWQVTILARKNGQSIASKQLSVNATGGM